MDNSKTIIHEIDEITWNDLNLDRIVSDIDCCYTGYGYNALVGMLRRPLIDKDSYNSRLAVIRELSANKALQERLLKCFARIGRKDTGDLAMLLGRIEQLNEKGNTNLWQDFLCLILGIIATVMIFAAPTVGFFLFLVVLFFNIITYFYRKKDIKDEIGAVCSVIRLEYNGMDFARHTREIVAGPALSQKLEAIDGLSRSLSGLLFGSVLITSGHSVTGSIADIILDYFRMFLHLDIIKFYLMVGNITKCRAQILEFAEVVGGLDAMISIVRYREKLPLWCEPSYEEDTKPFLHIKGLYHPLIKGCVQNDINTEGCILLTGSNASGKSTFLRSVGLAAVLGQSICTVTASEYVAPFFKVISSVATGDSVEKGDSYYVAEIKALLRIVKADSKSVPVLCIVDEVLRGTNTAERIAASMEILDSLAKKNLICFAATHDIELTSLLEKSYANYHFKEMVDDKSEGVLFPYKIEPGRNTSRNAIRLLEIVGFEKTVVDKATLMCDRFLKTGIWESE